MDQGEERAAERSEAETNEVGGARARAGDGRPEHIAVGGAARDAGPRRVRGGLRPRESGEPPGGAPPYAATGAVQPAAGINTAGVGGAAMAVGAGVVAC